MAFNINAQIILSGPKNLSSISKQISSQLGKATKINLNVGGSKQMADIGKKLDAINKNFGRLNSNLKSTRTSISALNSSFNKSAGSINNVGRAQSKLATQTGRTNTALKQQSSLLGNLTGRFGSVAKQAIAFGLISRPIYDVQRAFSAAVKDAVSFEKEIVKISQVTGNSVNELSGLKDEINRLATSLGTSANQLAETSRIIAQTGRSAAEIQPILAALAKSTLAPTFGSITDTTEGLIAALGQFQLSASQSEAILGSLNQVSKQFAVEAEDLISVVRRTGGVFAQAAGDSKGTIQALQELTAIFTAVRSTTRESADTIAAGLRTIFSRIQRRSTISFLKQFGVDLEDAQGRFIGIFPAFDQLSTKLDTLIKQGDALTLSAIAEELGGIRQIGKLLPAIAEFQKARDAFDAAQRGAVSGLEGDVDKGLQTISNRIDRVKQSFSELIRTLFESEGFQGAFKGLLSTTESILQTITSVVKTVEPILPLLTGLGTLKLGQAFGGFLAGGGLGKIGSAASTVTGQATAQAAQQNVQATQQNTSAVNQTNQILTRINTQIANLFTAINSSFTQNVNQLSNLIQINNSGFNNLARTLTSRPATIPVGGFGGRRASGGMIPKFANGGPVYGPSHAAGGVIAELEGGEYVIPKKYANGGMSAKGRRGNRAYVFDFDDTLGVSGSSGKELFSNDPQLAAARQDKLRNARATSLANSARKRSAQGFDVHVLTARFGTPGDEAALQDFLVKAGIKPGRTIFTGGLFKGEREPGKKPGTTRNLSTATKKSRILAELSKKYDSILFLDDAIENVLKAKDVKGVRPIAVNKQTQALRRAALGGLIQGYQPGGGVKAPPASAIRKELAKINKSSAIDIQPGTKIAGDLEKATLEAVSDASRLADLDTYAGAFLKPEGARQVFEGQSSRKDLETALKGLSPLKVLGSTGQSKVAKSVRRIIDTYSKKNTYKVTTGALATPAAERLEDTILRGVTGTVKASAKQISSTLGFSSNPATVARALKSANIDQVVGNIFESVLSFAGVPFDPSADPDPPNAPLDFPKGLSASVAKDFQIQAGVPTESKTLFTKKALSQFNRKIQNFNLSEAKKELLQVFTEFNKGLKTATQLKQVTGKKTTEEAISSFKSAGVTAKASGSKFALSRASGGEIPVRISNGEMVVTDPREVAARKGELQRINKLSTGGFASGTIARGPGTGTSDSIYTTLPQGAFVVNAASTKKYLGLRRGGGVQRFQGGGLSFGSNTATFKNQNQNQKQVQEGLSDLSGAAFTATFAIQSFVSAIEDGKVTSGELFNILLLVAPTVGQLASNFGQISTALKTFRADLKKSVPKQAPTRNGVPVLEPPGTARARRARRLRNTGIGVGAGLAATFVGEQIGGTTGATISGAGAGAAAGALLGPIGAGVGALVGGIAALESSIQEAAFKKASEGLKFSLESSKKSTDTLQKAIIDNTVTTELLASAFEKSEDVTTAAAGKIAKDFSKATGGLSGGDIGAGQKITGTISFGFEAIGDIIADGFKQGRRNFASRQADKALTGAADSLNKAGDQQLQTLSTVLGGRGVNIGGVKGRQDFREVLKDADFGDTEIKQAFEALGDVVKGLVPEYQAQIDGLKATGKITEEQAKLGKRLLFRIASGETVDENTGQSLVNLLEDNFSGVIDEANLTQQAFSALRANTIVQSLETKKLTKEINAFGIALGQLNKDISSAINNFNQSFDRIKQLAEGGFASTRISDPFENVSSATPQELQAGFDKLADEFGVQVSPLQKALVTFTNRQPEILKQAAQNIAGGQGAAEGIKNAFTQVTGLGGDALLSSPAFQTVIDNLSELGRSDEGAATVLKKLENALATGDFSELSTEVSNMVQGFSQLIQSTNALRQQFDANVDFEISLQRKELAARLKNAQRIQSFDPFGQRNVFDDLNERVSIASGSDFGGGARGASDPAALLARREELRAREATLSADPARDEAANAELREVRKELASNTDALTLLKDDTTRLAKINQDLANIQARRLQRRQELSRLSTDQGAQDDFFQNQFQALNNILSGRGITTDQAAGIAGLSVDDLAARIQAQNPDVSEEDALKQAKGIQANIAREQATSILRQRGIDEGSAEGQAFIRQFQVAFAKQGETAKEVNLTAQGNTIIESQNEIELKLATENTEKALQDLNASFKTLQDQIDAAVLRFQNLNNNIPQQGGQGNQGNQGNQGGVASSASSIPDTVALTSTNDVNVNVMGMDTANETFKNEVYGSVAARFDSMRTDSNGRPQDPSLQESAGQLGASPSTFVT